MKIRCKTFLVLAVLVSSASGSASEDSEVQQVALDYIHSWYVGDAQLMESTIHPDLVKRSIQVDPTTKVATLVEESAQQLLRKTAAGGASRRIPANKRRAEILEYSVGEGIAQVRIRAARWDELLQLGYLNGEWKVFNILWEMHPASLADE